jgi:signal transduction histidine kinase
MEDRTEWARVYDERTRLMELATINEVLPTFLHELKNPLASIQALVELIIEDCGDGTLRDQLHSILVEIRRMKLGFDGLGSTSRNLRSNRNQAIDLAIREACAIFERQLENRRIRLVTGIETLPLLPLDSGGVRGILFNLLNNAKQACRPGDVIKVNARLGDGGRSFVFEVRDSGSGMPAEVLEQCTRMFFTTKRTGSGIGLALCRDAVDKVGGRLEIRSTSGEGTNIRVSLPIEPNQNPWRNG